MQVVRHLGLTVAVDHPAAWIERGERIVRDLIEVFAHPGISARCLRNLIDQRRRLVGGRYAMPDGRGCLMFLLTEPLLGRQIRGKADLVRFFGREHGRPGHGGYVSAEDSVEYQPAKWLVRLVDGQFCEEIRARYGRACELFDYDLVLKVARQVLAQREIVTLSPEREFTSAS
ncbi:MAG: hypothetical protein SFU86_05740 [Pirellulaceae bacterium]|nr:hypothetical protein [Pirellulaceae bacterium]